MDLRVNFAVTSYESITENFKHQHSKSMLLCVYI